MTKKILIVLIVFLLTFITTASAQGNLYKGYNQVKVIWENHSIDASKDVPAIIFENRTMVPINLLKQVGINALKTGNTVTLKDKRTDYIKMISVLEGFKHENIEQLHRFNEQISSLTELIILNEVESEQIDSLVKSINDYRNNQNETSALIRTVKIGSDFPYELYHTVSICDLLVEALSHLKTYINNQDKTELHLFITTKQQGLESLKSMEDKSNTLTNMLFDRISIFNH
ncbi:hypothetical protein [Paenibacillus sp. BC26]|uniref:hypothetical protein n=1 Tax=Paenibacillus sp. BC26 TaxID=1881032 RepID=UPI0008F2928A|nr:hypothetical protein [Paenibacillus sp. BC26]SFS76485.1 hypothetical protein SAMN05428962_2722 [Paenibacillus sp. BC26]